MERKDELEQRLIDFVKNTGKEFPGIGKIIGGKIPAIEKDVRVNFSPMAVFRLRTLLGMVIQDEIEKQSFENKEVDVLAAIAAEHFNDQKLSGQKDREGLEKLIKDLDLEIRSRSLVEKAKGITRKLDELVGADRSILEQDVMMGICSSFVQLAKEKKPDEIPDLAKSLSQAETILKIYSLHEQASALDNERIAIVQEMRPEDDFHDPQKIAHAMAVLALKIRRLERNSVNYKDVETGKMAGIMLGKLKTYNRLEKRKQEFNDLIDELRAYFCETDEHSIDPFDLQGKEIIQGVFCAQ